MIYRIQLEASITIDTTPDSHLTDWEDMLLIVTMQGHQIAAPL